MKKIIFLLLAATPYLMSSTCKKDDYKNAEAVRLSAAINNSAEIIALGDTLKITLTIPSTITTESAQQINVSSLQKGWYGILANRIDTITKQNIGLNNTSAFFITAGSNSGGSIYVSNSNTPYTSVLNIVPPQKGVYYLEILPQPGQLNVNTTNYYGLKVNFAVADKHWVNFANYFNGPNQPDFLTSVSQRDSEGYGWYCFRVN